MKHEQPVMRQGSEYTDMQIYVYHKCYETGVVSCDSVY